jgi:hypothetical protein
MVPCRCSKRAHMGKRSPLRRNIEILNLRFCRNLHHGQSQAESCDAPSGKQAPILGAGNLGAADFAEPRRRGRVLQCKPWSNVSVAAVEPSCGQPSTLQSRSFSLIPQ